MMMYPSPPAANIFRLVAIDPGTDTLGVSVLDIDIENDYAIRVVYATTFKASKVVDAKTTEVQVLGSRSVRLRAHAQTLYEFLVLTQPNAVAAESPFLKRGRVSAFEALVLCYDMMMDVVFQYSPAMKLHRIDPISAKNSVGVSHIKTDKDDVRDAVLKIYSDKSDIDLTELDEHAIDSIAVGNCIYRRKVLGDIVESSKKKRKGRGRKRRGKKK